MLNRRVRSRKALARLELHRVRSYKPIPEPDPEPLPEPEPEFTGAPEIPPGGYEEWKQNILLGMHAKKCWIRLISSKAFRVNANHNWLVYERFIGDIGLPTSLDQVIFKNPTHQSYTKFSVRWATPIKE